MRCTVALVATTGTSARTAGIEIGTRQREADGEIVIKAMATVAMMGHTSTTAPTTMTRTTILHTRTTTLLPLITGRASASRLGAKP